MCLRVINSMHHSILLLFFVSLFCLLKNIRGLSSSSAIMCEQQQQNLPTKYNQRELSRKIKLCTSSEQAFALLERECSKDSSDGPYLAAMRLFGKEKRYDLATRVFHKHPTEPLRTWAISICGKCDRHEQALELLFTQYGSQLSPSVASYNAAIAACNHNKRGYWQSAIKVLESMPKHMITTLTVNAVFTCFVKAKNGAQAKILLYRMIGGGDGLPAPDRNSYHQAIRALIKAEDIESAYTVLQEMEKSDGMPPNSEIYDTMACAYARFGQWEMSDLMNRRRDECDPKKKESCQPSRLETSHFNFAKWNYPGLVKHNKGKGAYWSVGEYKSVSSSFTVALRPHRDPSRNGIKLAFYETDSINTLKSKKLGFLLMINSPDRKKGCSTLLGFLVSPNLRGQGLAKLFVAIWLHFCLEAGITPETGIINKPLISLVLQQNFGMIPSPDQHGLDAELSIGENGGVVLYSPNSKNLAGIFSPLDQKTQSITLSHIPTEPRGRPIRVSAAFEVPEDTTLFREKVHATLKGKEGDGSLIYDINRENLRTVFLGK